MDEEPLYSIDLLMRHMPDDAIRSHAKSNVYEGGYLATYADEIVRLRNIIRERLPASEVAYLVPMVGVGDHELKLPGDTP